ncbi:hypothetical protein, variant [Aphanomyces invadans]|uniref:Transmembrane protein n=1 Tax=Aphanomyces invadans TaxID=157072 RepID=A0A024UPG8_9STRA|nr:hypothetical protein, variant [Aphanomyces invadans]ETW07742.1 hypothetical protein, variant [Aphanomyces invadans]|eukprot:XP_008863835.1 hypothetical protein, variant [Aphanomyces invadans]
MVCTTSAAIGFAAVGRVRLGFTPKRATALSGPTTLVHVGLFTMCLETQSNHSVADPRHPNAVYTCAELSSATVYQLNCTTTKRSGFPSHCSAIETIDSVQPLCANVTRDNGVHYSFNWHALTVNQQLDRTSVAAVQLSRFLNSACGVTGQVVQSMGTAMMISSCAFTACLIFESLCLPFAIMRHVLHVAMGMGWLTVLSSVVLFISWGFEASHLGSFKFSEVTYVAFGGVVLSMVALASTHVHATAVYSRRRRHTSVGRGNVYVDPKTRLHVLVDSNEATMLEVDDADEQPNDDLSCLPITP